MVCAWSWWLEIIRKNFCIRGHHLRSIRFLLSLGLHVVLQATGDGPVVGIDEFTNKSEGSFFIVQLRAPGP